MVALTQSFSTLAPQYDVLLSDVWGVTHNGIAAFPEACDVLRRFRENGGTVILITNAPRPSDAIRRQITRYGVPKEAYDDIVSSGDVSRGVVSQRKGQKVFHLGPERDVTIFDGLDLRFTSAEEADYVVCTGLFDDETESPEDYRELLAKLRARKLFMVCGNPDAVVERGDRMLYCAGAIADLYAEMGGEVLYAGKPYRPIYEDCLRKAQELRTGSVDKSRVLAIGDSVRTDVRGATDFGIDCLFITAGIHAEELGGRDDPGADALDRIFSRASLWPKAVMTKLR